MENDKLKELKIKANRLPKSPGVYIMKDKNKSIIYIGKAKALKSRVTQYFGKGTQHTQKVKNMVSLVDDFEYIICDSEFEALVLECSLIKQHQPKYNILLKDDKGYHYIKITDEKWPKIVFANKVSDDGKYIGPYYSAYVVKDTVDCANMIFKLPDCNRNFDKRTKPCLNFHIGRCDAPCRGNIPLKEYKDTVKSAVEFIKNGDTDDILPKLYDKMNRYSDNLDFENAAKYRDRINAIKKLGERQKVVMCTYKEQDVFASAFIGETACVSVFNFKNGKLSDKNHYFVNGVFDRDTLYSEFIKQYYYDKSYIPPRVLLDSDFTEKDLIVSWLKEKRNGKFEIIIPKAGEQKSIVNMCLNNAADNLSHRTKSNGKQMSALNELASLLGLGNVPKYIESYDISNLSGEENVASMVVFKDGVPYKKNYRRFKIKTFAGQDDYRSMAEVLSRRIKEYKKGTDEAFSVLPDLILLDGGIGQINAVMPIFNKENISVPIFGMVKDSKHKTRAIASSGGDIAIKSNKASFSLITKIQDEVHRFAITYHRLLRSKKMLDSELLNIKGIGKKRAKELILHFKTLENISKASIEDLEKIPEISSVNAINIYNYFHDK